MIDIYQVEFNAQDVKVLERNIVYDGFSKIVKYKISHRLFTGGWSKTLTRELFEPGGSVGILLLDPVLKKIVLVEQLRLAAVNQPGSPWLLELAAGMMAANEKAAQVAKREVKEESGLIVQDMLPIVDCWVSPGGSNEKISLFCAKIDASQAGGIHGLKDEGEDIKVWVFSIQEIYELLDSGKIITAHTLIALQWFRLNEQKVLSYWA